MSFLPDELPVSLEKLEDHLKAILKIKLREFVHLNPIFNCIPSIDVESYCKATDCETSLAQAITASVEESSEAVVDRVPSPEILSRSQFRQNILNRTQAVNEEEAQKAHGEFVVSLNAANYYFSGHDIECPNRFRKLPQRRRYTRRSTV